MRFLIEPDPHSDLEGLTATARAEYLRQPGRTGEARLAYDEALLLAGNTTERDHLTARRAGLDP